MTSSQNGASQANHSSNRLNPQNAVIEPNHVLPPNNNNFSENGKIVTEESSGGLCVISVSDYWELICKYKAFGVLKDDVFNRILEPDLASQLPGEVVCLICLQKLRGCLFPECGHLFVCMECQLYFQACPVCKKNIKSFIHVSWDTCYG